MAGAVLRLWCLEHDCRAARPGQGKERRETGPLYRAHTKAKTGL